MNGNTSIFHCQRPEDSPGFLLWQVSNMWQRRLNEGLRQVGLTHVQFVLLSGIEWLSYSQEQITQVQLASHAKADVMTTSKVLRSLERKAYVRRDIHPTDTRAKCVALTKTGREVLLSAIKLVEEIDGEFFSTLNDRIMTFNTQLLELIHQNSDHQ